MNKQLIYKQFREIIEGKLQFLDDKPEESLDSTLQTLWLAATGTFIAAEEASEYELPDLTPEQKIRLNELIERRLNNIPLAHITRRQKFMGINFIVDKRALIPRKETEIVGNKALQIARKIAGEKRNIRIIDVCCGSGNLGLSLAKLIPGSSVYETDLSEEAVELTKENIRFLGLENQVEARHGDFFEAFESDDFYGNIDLIVCNPPYISTSKVEKMPSEIALNEPSLAFDGGMMGIKIIQKLLTESPKFLNKDGWIAFETGLGQGPLIIQLLERNGNYSSIGPAEDKAGNIRAISAKRKK